MKEGAPTPAPMLDRPRLDRVGHWYLDTHQQLARSRTLGSGGEYYIPLSEFDAFFRIRKIDDVETRVRVIRVVQAVDEQLLTAKAEKRSAETK